MYNLFLTRVSILGELGTQEKFKMKPVLAAEGIFRGAKNLSAIFRAYESDIKVFSDWRGYL